MGLTLEEDSRALYHDETHDHNLINILEILSEAFAPQQDEFGVGTPTKWTAAL